jgi:hypothetical protein
MTDGSGVRLEGRLKEVVEVHFRDPLHPEEFEQGLLQIGVTPENAAAFALKYQLAIYERIFNHIKQYYKVIGNYGRR